MRWAVLFQMTARIWASASLSVKYQCPDGLWRLKLEISPVTQTTGNAPSTISFSTSVNCETVSTGSELERD